MFEITQRDDGSINLQGRFDAAQVENARTILEQLEDSCVVDFQDLIYISSGGLGLLFATQKRLVDGGKALKLANLSPHIREIFQIAGFDTIFEIIE